MKTSIISLMSLFCLSACVTTFSPSDFSQITKVNDIVCSEKAERMYLFFEGEPVDYAYERIGLVEASGAQYTQDETVMDYLKYEAWNACANAIINIRRDYKMKEENFLLDDENDGDRYDVTVFSGLAVRIHTDSAFVNKYGQGLDTSFRQSVTEDINQQIKAVNAITTASVVMSVVGIVLMLVMIGSF